MRVELDPNVSGGLLIWQHPQPGRKYIVSGDTAEGLSRGDFAASTVIDGDTCDLVAGYRERERPHPFGQKLAMVCAYYNDAILAVETYPSTHGVTAVEAAVKVGHKNIYRRRRVDTTTKAVSEVVGWHTNSTTKPVLIDRIALAMQHGVAIPWEDLLLEIRRQYWNDQGQMESKGHDDLVMAYGIALVVRDHCFVAGKLRVEPVEPKTETERVWAWIEKQRKGREMASKRRPLAITPSWRTLRPR